MNLNNEERERNQRGLQWAWDTFEGASRKVLKERCWSWFVILWESKFKYDHSVVRYCSFVVEQCVDFDADGSESG